MVISPEPVRGSGVFFFGPKEADTKAERRKYARANIGWPIVMETAERFVYGNMLDVSTAGAFIRCRRPLGILEVARMVIIDVNLQGDSIVLEARVMWSRVSGADNELTPHGMGLQFINITADCLRAISNLTSDRVKNLGID